MKKRLYGIGSAISSKKSAVHTTSLAWFDDWALHFLDSVTHQLFFRRIHCVTAIIGPSNPNLTGTCQKIPTLSCIIKKSAIVALNSREYILLLLLVLVVENWEAAEVLILVWSLPLRCYSLIWLYKYAAISMKRIAGCGSIVWKKISFWLIFWRLTPNWANLKR